MIKKSISANDQIKKIAIENAENPKKEASTNHSSKDNKNQQIQQKSLSEKGTQVDIKTMVKDIGLNSESAKAAAEEDTGEPGKKIKS